MGIGCRRLIRGEEDWLRRLLVLEPRRPLGRRRRWAIYWLVVVAAWRRVCPTSQRAPKTLSTRF